MRLLRWMLCQGSPARSTDHLSLTRWSTVDELGREEHRLAWHLVRQKLKVVQQAPCGPYRIDVGIWPVAVEV